MDLVLGEGERGTMGQEPKEQSEMRSIHQIYDSIFKKVMTLSPRAVVSFINGLYGTDYPLDSYIGYNWTESHDRNLQRTLADVILTIDHQNSYHMEAQTGDDSDIVFRVYQYGFHHAARIRDRGSGSLKYPEACVLYLNGHKDVSEYQSMTLELGNQQKCEYRVKTFCYQDYTLEELKERNMIILIPFQLLKFRETMEKNPTKENIAGLKKLISDDIVMNIRNSYEAGDITKEDAWVLADLTRKLCEHLYGKNEVCVKEGVLDMYGDIILLESERILYEHQKEKEKLEKELAERDAEIARLKAQLGQAV